jgi:hypothetical protein
MMGYKKKKPIEKVAEVTEEVTPVIEPIEPKEEPKKETKKPVKKDPCAGCKYYAKQGCRACRTCVDFNKGVK